MIATTQQAPLRAAHELLTRAIDGGEVPGAVALVRRDGHTLLHDAYGRAATEPQPQPMRLDTLFDLASLTKPLATAPVILSLVDRGLLGLHDPVARYLPELDTAGARGIAVRHLLTHTSGLPAGHPLYADEHAGRDVLSVIASLPRAPLERQVEYSCLGYIVLGTLAERVTGRPLDALTRELIAEPLGARTLAYNPALSAERYASTERGNAFERGTAGARGMHFDRWRTDFHPGQVHDGNAFYALQGVAGNAGLFGTAEDVAAVAEMWLGGGRRDGRRILSASIAGQAIRDWTPGLDSARGLGWTINRPAGSGRPAVPSAGSRLSSRAFGHTGFTGTSLWIDPVTRLIAVLLTNRVHPAVDSGERIQRLRAAFHDAVIVGITA